MLKLVGSSADRRAVIGAVFHATSDSWPLDSDLCLLAVDSRAAAATHTLRVLLHQVGCQE